MKRNKNFTICILSAMVLLATIGCKKNDYYHETGVHNPVYNGTVLQYLENNPHHLFDSVVKVIKLAGMENIFKNDSITFFAPTDTAIINSMRQLNSYLFALSKDTVTDLSELSPAFWRQQLSLYLFRGVHRLKDYPQVDLRNPQLFGGQYYASYEQKVMFIGVTFSDAGGVQYAGYRQLLLGYFPGDAAPYPLPATYPVASSDINPSNGIVHVLNYSAASYFGFYSNQFVLAAIAAGITYSG